MAGNSKRIGAVRKEGSKKGPQVGSGGKGRRALEGKGPTPKAEDRPHHPAHRAKELADRAVAKSPHRGPAPRRKVPGGPEVVAGRNAVLEALRAGVHAESLHLFSRIEADDRVSELLRLALEADVPVNEVTKSRLDLLTGAAAHQGVALIVEPFRYLDLHDLLAAPGLPLIVALDGIQDPRNLGAIIRSAAAFGATGVLLPERRAAGVTVAAWKTSAGAVARMPIARVTNLARALEELKAERIFTLGLAADGEVALADSGLLVEPLALVIGSEGKGLSRLVREACDEVVSIPISASTESLNASVAASLALYEVRKAR
jgi:23S rRNA (guanosine2251-2'-O)-methyltransferase